MIDSCVSAFVTSCADGTLNETTYVMPTSEIELAWASLQFAVITHSPTSILALRQYTGCALKCNTLVTFADISDIPYNIKH